MLVDSACVLADASGAETPQESAAGSPARRRKHKHGQTIGLPSAVNLKAVTRRINAGTEA